MLFCSPRPPPLPSQPEIKGRLLVLSIYKLEKQRLQYESRVPQQESWLRCHDHYPRYPLALPSNNYPT